MGKLVSCMRSRGRSGPDPLGIPVIIAPWLAEFTGRSKSMCQPRPSDREGEESEPVLPGAGLFLALPVPLYLWITPARSSVSSQEMAMPPSREGWGDAPGVGRGQDGPPTHTAPTASPPSGGRSI